MKSSSKFASIFTIIWSLLCPINPAIGSEVDLIKVSECNATMRNMSKLLIKMRNENQKLHRHLNYIFQYEIKERKNEKKTH